MQRNIYNYATLFVWNPRTSDVNQVNNATGADITIPIGTVMGRIVATGYLVPMVSTVTDGSQIPIGVMVATTVIPANTIANVTIFIQGDVVASGLVFSNGTDTIRTNVTLTSGDIIGSITDVMNGKGMVLVANTEGTYYDN